MNDVRMQGFSHRHAVDEVVAWIEECVVRLPGESVSLLDAAGRVAADDVVSQVDVPAFERSMMDGYAVVASDTQGASAYNRLRLDIVDQSLPGRPSTASVSPGRAVRIMTGAPMPEGADAVVPVEGTEPAGAADRSEGVYILEGVPVGKHVGRVGEDIPSGATVVSSGRILRPQDLGVLSSIGVAAVSVVRRPTVSIVITGREILPAGTRPEGCRIADANGPMLRALAVRDGGSVASIRMVPDERDALRRALEEPADVRLVTGASSVGQEDIVPSVVAELGELVFHGLAMRPSSPAGVGRIGESFVFLLPGNPVSALCAYDFFAGRAIRRLGGLPSSWPYRRIERPLTRHLNSMLGRTDYARVRLTDGGVEPLAIGGASVLSSTTRADGFVIVPASSEGIPAGTMVDVWLYESWITGEP